jgi:PTS system mannitol-specific IIC component
MRKFGQLLSAMVFQNIAVIIAVGILRELFGMYGWWYNDRILLLVDPIYYTLLPILLGYTGGKLLGGQRGAVVASIVTYGLTLASSAPAILGAMIVGPFTGWLVNKLDQLVKRNIPVGYELLVGNVIAAIVGVCLTIASFLYVGQTMSQIVKWSIQLLENVVYAGWLPLTALMIEPAKVFFFNNIINFGVLGPLGIQQAKELGKSIFFLLEANPGPGLGVLLAYWFQTKGNQRKGAKFATFIHLFGGIHEVYFPYVLRNPVLLLAVMSGGVTGIILFQLFDVGLVSIASPGSIFLLAGLSPKEDIGLVMIGVLVSAFVSFIISVVFLDPNSTSPSVEENREHIAEYEKLGKIEKIHNELVEKKEERTSTLQAGDVLDLDLVLKDVQLPPIRKISFVCEAGMGSSAMGAALLRKKFMQVHMNMEVDNSSIHMVSEDCDLIICHQKLLTNVKKEVPHKIYYPLSSFTDMDRYDELIALLQKGNK